MNIAQRYALADTALCDEWHTKIDPLIAAGFCGGVSDHAFALQLLRARETGRITDWSGMAARISTWIPRDGISQETASDIAANVLLWWLRDKVCPKCFGTKHPLIPGSNRADESRKCEPCRGTGRLFVERCVDPEHTEQARALASRLEGLQGVFGAMAQRLKGD